MTGELPMPPPMPPPDPSSRLDGPAPRKTLLQNPIVRVVLGWVALCAVVVGYFAWSPGDESHPALGVGEGLVTIGTAVLLGSPFVLAAAGLLASRSTAARVLAVPFLAIAGFLGFFAGVVVAAGRCTTCDDA